MRLEGLCSHGARHRSHTLTAGADFKALLVDLAKRTTTKPPTAAEEFQLIVGNYQGNQNRYKTAISRARLVMEKRKAAAKKPQFESVARQVLAMAQKHPEEELALNALGWIVQSTGPEMSFGRQAPDHELLRDEAVRIVERDHLTKQDINGLCWILANSPSPSGDRLLRIVAEKHPKNDVRGLAHYALAWSLDYQHAWLRATNPTQAAEIAKQTEAEYDVVIKQYGDVAFGQSTLGNNAKFWLHKFRYLQIGCVAQDIDGEDIAGKRLKLSDHRGNVVVISFWANWCGYCRQMYPQERQMYQRLKGQPFVLLGINCDDNRPAVAALQKKHGLVWRSWWNDSGKNGSISNDWQVNSFPTTYVLDHKGVIRYENLRSPQLDAAVDQLLRELQAEKSAGANGR